MTDIPFIFFITDKWYMDSSMENICWTSDWADNGSKILEVQKNQLLQRLLSGHFTFINLWYSENRVYIDLLAIRIGYIMTNQYPAGDLLMHFCFQSRKYNRLCNVSFVMFFKMFFSILKKKNSSRMNQNFNYMILHIIFETENYEKAQK